MARPYKILIVEDEMIIAAKISLFLTELGYEVVGMIPRAEDALLIVSDHQPDIALLDIQLKGSMDGIALGKVLQLEYQVPVIFLTANADDATFDRSKEARPYAFLSKPFKKMDLQRALELTISLMESKSTTQSEDRQEDNTQPQVLADRIFVYYKDKKVKLLFSDICYIEAERNYCRIVTTEKEYLLTMPMKSLEEVLPPQLFQRIHRSHIVNITHVSEISDSTIKVNDKKLALSKSFQKEFLNRIKSV